MVLHELNGFGKPNEDKVVAYTLAINAINDNFGTKYSTYSLYDIKVTHFDEICGKLPLRD